MNADHIARLVARYRIELRDGQLGSVEDLTPEAVEEIRPHREAIMEFLTPPLVALQPAPQAPVEDADPWRHATPGVERMEDAQTVLRRWKRNGLSPEVSWGPPIQVMDPPTGKTLKVPSYILPEILFLLLADGQGSPRDDQRGHAGGAA